MTVHDPSLAQSSGGILRWLGFKATRPEAPDDPAPVAEPPANEGIDDPRERRRRQLLEDICRFLLTHRLEISGYTLTIAYEVLTGANPRLAHLIEERVARRKPVTLRWLEEVMRGPNNSDGVALLDTLMARLETSIEGFDKTTTAARSATQSYNSALQAHVGELEQVGKAGAVISELANVARAMLTRTRELEREMQRTEEETKTLKKSLDDARHDAEIDHLTGLLNRRAFDAVLAKEYAEAIARGEPLCVAFCDLDHFKRINDTHGHEAGDRVLRATAKSLSSISDDRCHVARHGGEEFVVLFRDKPIAVAWEVLDAARQAIAERRLVNRSTDLPFGKITFSAGIADVFAYENPGEALRAADAALYAAKNGGRDRVVLAEPPGDRAPARKA